MSHSLDIRGVTYQVRVSDFDAAMKWYGGLLGRPPDFLPHEGFEGHSGFAEWRLMAESECWLQVAEGSPSAGSGPIRFGVDDIHFELDRLKNVLGLEPPQVGQTPDGNVKFCTFEDPYGNRVGLYQDLSS